MSLRCEIGCEIAEGMDPEKKGRKMRKVKLVTKLIINRMEIAAIIATSIQTNSQRIPDKRRRDDQYNKETHKEEKK